MKYQITLNDDDYLKFNIFSYIIQGEESGLSVPRSFFFQFFA